VLLRGGAWGKVVGASLLVGHLSPTFFFDFVSDENEVSEKVFLGTSDPMTELSIRALCHNFGKFIRTSSAP
jgi:hypothetical protein